MTSSLPAALRRAARLAAVPMVSGALIFTAGTGQATAAITPVHAATLTPFQQMIQRITLPSDYFTLRYGQTHARIAFVQLVLRVSPRTGYFGPLTYEAVRRWQAAVRLPVTGQVDPTTMRYLIYRYLVYKSAYDALAARARTQAAASSSTAAARILAYARSTAVGAYYVYAGMGPNGYDCSGYVGTVVRRATGKVLPRASYSMRAAMPSLSSSSVRAGDLVFVHNGGGGRVSHVAIYAGNGYWWEASNPRTGVGLHKAWTSNVSFARV